MLNDELKSSCLSFRIPYSAFIVYQNRVSTGKEEEKIKQD